MKYYSISVYWRCIILLLIIFSSNIYSQELYITGAVKDKEKKESLIGANVYISGTGKYSKGTSTDITGKFNLRNIPAGKYTLTISCVGYKNYERNFEIKDKPINFGVINLKQDTINLDEVTTFGKAIRIQQKNDTLEYNPKAYKLQIGSDASDLIAKLPGISVNNDQIKVQGKEVKKVLIDGKPAYEDKRTTMQAVPSDMIDNVQVYDKLSENDEFRGFEDGEKSTVIDIKTTSKFKKSRQAQLSGGVANEEGYSGSGSLTIMNGLDRYLSSVSTNNNMNANNNINSGEVVNNKQPNKKYGRQSLQGNIQNAFSEKFNLSLTTNYTSSSNESESSLFRNYYLEAPNNQNYEEKNKKETDFTNFSLRSEMIYQIDSLNILRFSPSYSFQGNEMLGMVTGKTLSSGKFLNSIINESKSGYDRYLFLGSLQYNRRFSKKGRIFNLGLFVSADSWDNTSEVFFKRIKKTSISPDTTIQNMPKNDNGINYSFDVGFIEPVNSAIVVRFTLEYQYNQNENELKTFMLNNLDGLFTFDTAQSNKYKRCLDNVKLRLGASYSLTRNLGIYGGITYQSVKLNYNNSFPISYEIHKTFYSYLPSISFDYKIDRNNNMSLMSGFMSKLPRADQIRNVPDISNPLYVIIGNPELNQTNELMVMFNYMYSNPEIQSVLRVSGDFSYSWNLIGNSTYLALNDTIINSISLSQGARLIKPINIDGNYSLDISANYSLPVDIVSSNLDFGINYEIIRDKNLLNNEEIITKGQSLGVIFNVKSNISEDIDINLQTDSRYNFGSSQLLGSIKQKYFNQNTNLNLSWNFYSNIRFSVGMSYKYEGDIFADTNPNEYNLSINFGKKLFKLNQGEIKLGINNIFDNKDKFSRNVYDYYYQETKSTSFGRCYFALFKYSIRNF